MNVVDVADKITIVAQRVLPISPRPNAPFTPDEPAFRTRSPTGSPALGEIDREEVAPARHEVAPIVCHLILAYRDARDGFRDDQPILRALNRAPALQCPQLPDRVRNLCSAGNNVMCHKRPKCAAASNYPIIDNLVGDGQSSGCSEVARRVRDSRIGIYGTRA
jgi:hypothetical protein